MLINYTQRSQNVKNLFALNLTERTSAYLTIVGALSISLIQKKNIINMLVTVLRKHQKQNLHEIKK